MTPYPRRYEKGHTATSIGDQEGEQFQSGRGNATAFYQPDSGRPGCWGDAFRSHHSSLSPETAVFLCRRRESWRQSLNFVRRGSRFPFFLRLKFIRFPNLQLKTATGQTRVKEGSGKSEPGIGGFSFPRNCRCQSSNTAREKSSLEYLPVPAFSKRSFSTVRFRKYPLAEVSLSSKMLLNQFFKSPRIHES